MSNKNQIQIFFTNLYQDILEKYNDIRETEIQKSRAIAQIALIGAIAAWLVTPVYMLGETLSGQIQFEYLVRNNLILAIGLSITYLLARLKIKLVPAFLMAFLVEITFIRVNFYVENLGIILSVILLAIVINISIQGLQKNPAILLFITGLLAAGASIVLDNFFQPAMRLASPLWLQQAVIVTGGLVVLFVSLNFLNSRNFTSVRQQLSLSSLFLLTVPIFTILAVAFLTQRAILREIEGEELQRVTFVLADEVDLQIKSLLSNVENEAKIPTLRKYLAGEQARNEATEALNALSAQNEFILSYGILDARGNIRVDTLPFYMGQDESNSEWFQETITQQTGYMSKIFYDSDLLRPVFYISAPIMQDGEVLGVLRAQYDSNFLREIMASRINRFAPDFALMLVDQNGIILAHTSQPDLQQKTISILTQEQLNALQSTRQLPQGTAESLSANLVELTQSITNNPSGGDVFTAPLNQRDTTSTNFATSAVAAKNWYLVSGQPEITNAFSVFQRNPGAIFVIVFIFLSSIFAISNSAQWITTPLSKLAQMAQEVGRGNLNISADISRRDELGDLARSFNATTAQLRNTLQNLEENIDDRTQELAQANELANQRAEQMRVISSVALAVNKLQNLQILLPQITEEISKAFDYYHVGIFLIDPSGQYAVLQAANSEGGRRMLARGHRLRVGQVGIVGFVTGFGRGRIALDVGEDATFFNNPDLPNTHSEMALPLKSGNTIIGALDLQSEISAAFSQEDIDSLSLLAEQISTAIENSRLFDETQTALLEARLVYSKNVRESWRQILSTEKSAFRFTNGKVFENAESSLRPDENEENSITLPIVLRGETLGNLKIKHPSQHEWSEQDLRILQSIVDRVGFALENARLLQNAQRLVSKEQLIGEISDKINRSTNIDSILQTAIEELGHIITDSEVTIQVGEHEDTQA
jgi:GAF domain-containing protein/HAMP domain-containing protein